MADTGPEVADSLVRYASATDFLAALEPVLAEREDEHNLLLGVTIARRAAEAAGFEQDPAFFAHLGPVRSPRAALMMTPPFPLLIAHLDGPTAAVAAEVVHAMRSAELPTGGVLAAPEMADAFRDRWTTSSGGRVRATMKERLHRIETVEPVPMRPGRLVVAGPEHFALLVDWLTAFQAEAVPDQPPSDPARTVGLGIEQGDYFVWEEDGEPLGMAARARRTPRGICINAVYTPPAGRGHGVATSCVAALTRLLLKEVEFCVLYTDLANPTSNALYRRIGYHPVQDFTLHWFGPPGGG